MIGSYASLLLARDPVFREHSIQSMTGISGRQRVQIEMLSSCFLLYPFEKIWAEFSALASRMFAGMELNCKESLVLATLRDTLLL